MELKEKLDENVYYYTDVFKNPKWIIDTLEELDEDENTYPAITKWFDWLSSNDSKHSFGKRKDMFFDYRNSISGKNSEKVKTVIEEMKKGVDSICHSFIKDRGLDITPNISPSLDMCKYTPGGSLGVHHDTQDGDRSLMYSIVMYFNDDCEGGEISFCVDKKGKSRPSPELSDPNIDFWIKPLPGSALIFPSTPPYLHQSHPIISGNKYMSTSFIFVPEFNPLDPKQVQEYRNSN